MAELGLTPASRSRIAVDTTSAANEPLQVNIVRFIVDPQEDGPPTTIALCPGKPKSED